VEEAEEEELIEDIAPQEQNEEIKEEKENPVVIPEVDPIMLYIRTLFNNSTSFLKQRELITRYNKVISSPVPKYMNKLECTITRDKSGLSKKVYPVYTLTHSQSGKLLLAAKKMNMVRSAHYLLTMDSANLTKKSPGYLAKLRSDNSGIEYNLFDTGENPKTVKEPEKEIGRAHV
jgi:hypothetical protein